MTRQETPADWLRPTDGPDVVYEFFAPFAHVPGRFEWCRIRSPTHGVFDTFILVGLDPVTVYVSSRDGERFMADRYPECDTYRVEAEKLHVREGADGRQVEGHLRTGVGPVRTADMRLTARLGATPRNAPYGGEGAPVWGSRRHTCWGVDLVLDATAEGHVKWEDGRVEGVDGDEAVVTLGSFGRIAPLPSLARRRQA